MDLAEVFHKFGEEPLSKELATVIVEKRSQKPLKTTSDLVEIIQNHEFQINSYKPRIIMKAFQALRIAVN